ncbi:MAG TPA: protein kinase [Nannocystis sp.]
MSDPGLIGAIIEARYEILAVLGEGGMGTVYRARRLRVPGHAALKVLQPELVRRPDAHERFRREASAAAAIDHPNVVQVYDSGFLPDGSAYYAMELLSGENLSTTIEREHRLPWSRLRHIALQICGALRKAHSLGIIHRDLKPENCFRVVGGEDPDFIKVLDFGIAKIVAPEFSDDVRLTGTGDLLGTTPYMAPEQVRGQRVDHRIDIYALGVILFQALTGQLPFDGANRAQVLAAILLNDTPTMHGVDPYARVPPELEKLVACTLHKDPTRRFQSMDALAEAIRALPPDLPLAPMPEGPPRPVPGVIATRGWTEIVGGDPLAERGHTEVVDITRSDGPVLGSPGPANKVASATPAPAASRSGREDILLTEDVVHPRRRLRGPAAAVLGALIVLTAGMWAMLPDPPPPQAAITVPQPQVIVAPPVLPDPDTVPPPAIEEPTDEDPPSSTPVVLTARDVELRVERWRKSVEAQPPKPCQFGLTREFRLEAEVRDATVTLRSGASLPADHERCREDLERSLRRRFPTSRAIKGGLARVEKIRLLLR